jgi:hypothetical protein
MLSIVIPAYKKAEIIEEIVRHPPSSFWKLWEQRGALEGRQI